MQSLCQASPLASISWRNVLEHLLAVAVHTNPIQGQAPSPAIPKHWADALQAPIVSVRSVKERVSAVQYIL